VHAGTDIWHGAIIFSFLFGGLGGLCLSHLYGIAGTWISCLLVSQ